MIFQSSFDSKFSNEDWATKENLQWNIFSRNLYNNDVQYIWIGLNSSIQ